MGHHRFDGSFSGVLGDGLLTESLIFLAHPALGSSYVLSAEAVERNATLDGSPNRALERRASLLDERANDVRHGAFDSKKRNLLD